MSTETSTTQEPDDDRLILRGRPTRAEAMELDLKVRHAAITAFLEKGYDGATMNGIAAAAGVTKRSLYARYDTKHALFVDVVRWAIAHYRDDDPGTAPDDSDLESALLAMGRMAIARAVDPVNVRLKRIVLDNPSRFPEFAVAADSMMWSGRHRAVVDLLSRHQARGEIAGGNLELAAEHFLVMVEALPARLAEFGMRRTKSQEDKRLREAVALLLNGLRPR